MIECKKVSFSYPPNETDIGDRKGHGTLRNIDLSINDGDFVLLCGTSGCGKTTLTRLFNGLIPHYYDGKLEGTVMLDGEDMSGLSLFDISKKVGSVFQNPRSQFFNVFIYICFSFIPDIHIFLVALSFFLIPHGIFSCPANLFL